MEFIVNENESKLLCFYEFITGDKYLSSQIEEKESVLTYICYILNQLGFDLGRYKFTWDDNYGVYSFDLKYKIKSFNAWGKVSLVDLIVSEYTKTETLRNISEILNDYTNTKYSLKDYLGCIAALFYMENQGELEQNFLEDLENHSPFIDKTSNANALEKVRELKR